MCQLCQPICITNVWGFYFCHIWWLICNTFALWSEYTLFELLLFVSPRHPVCITFALRHFERIVPSFLSLFVYFDDADAVTPLGYFNPESRGQNQWKHLKNPSTFVSSQSQRSRPAAWFAFALPIRNICAFVSLCDGAIVIVIGNTRHKFRLSGCRGPRVSSEEVVVSCWKRMNICACQICDNIVNFNMKLRFFLSGKLRPTNAGNFSSCQGGSLVR